MTYSTTGSIPAAEAEEATGRRRRVHDPESVLRTAVGVFYERGYDGTSMADLARALGTAKSAIYYHVPGKEQLLGRALDRALDGLDELMAEEREATGPAAERLRRVVRRSVAVLLERLPYVTLLLRARGNNVTELRALERRREFDQFVAALVKEAVAEGQVRPDLEPALVGRLLFGMIASITDWPQPIAGSADDLADTVLAVAFDGLGVR